MIRYALICEKGHGFESWFKNSAAFDRQARQKLVTCPRCGSAKVEKAIMAPGIAQGTAPRRGIAEKPEKEAAKAGHPQEPSAPMAAEDAKAPVAVISPQEQELRKKLKEVRDHLVKNADYVGQKFPEEARKMHYGESEPRSIFGEASAEEAKKLDEEGIEFHTLPVLPEDRN